MGNKLDKSHTEEQGSLIAVRQNDSGGLFMGDFLAYLRDASHHSNVLSPSDMQLHVRGIPPDWDGREVLAIKSQHLSTSDFVWYYFCASFHGLRLVHLSESNSVPGVDFNLDKEFSGLIILLSSVFVTAPSSTKDTVTKCFPPVLLEPLNQLAFSNKNQPILKTLPAEHVLSDWVVCSPPKTGHLSTTRWRIILTFAFPDFKVFEYNLSGRKVIHLVPRFAELLFDLLQDAKKDNQNPSILSNRFLHILRVFDNPAYLSRLSQKKYDAPELEDLVVDIDQSLDAIVRSSQNSYHLMIADNQALVRLYTAEAWTNAWKDYVWSMLAFNLFKAYSFASNVNSK